MIVKCKEAKMCEKTDVVSAVLELELTDMDITAFRENQHSSNEVFVGVILHEIVKKVKEMEEENEEKI